MACEGERAKWGAHGRRARVSVVVQGITPAHLMREGNGRSGGHSDSWVSHGLRPITSLKHQTRVFARRLCREAKEVRKRSESAATGAGEDDGPIEPA